MSQLVTAIIESYVVIGCCVAAFCIARYEIMYWGEPRVNKCSFFNLFKSLFTIAVIGAYSIVVWPWVSRWINEPGKIRSCLKAGEIVAVNFDGVIAKQLPEGELFEHDKFGELLPYAAESINEILSWGCNVVIWTCRAESEALRQYLRDHGIEHSGINVRLNAGNDLPHSGKIPAKVYIDDRNLWEIGTPFSWVRVMKRMRVLLRPPHNKVDGVDVQPTAAWSRFDRRAWQAIRRAVKAALRRG